MFAGEKINTTEKPRRPAHRPAQFLRQAGPGRRQGRHAGGDRRARKMPTSPRTCARGACAARSASRSPTSSTSASAAPTSARPWRPARSRPYAPPQLRSHFVSNVDGADIGDTLARARPGAHAVHRLVEDLHHPGDDDQRRSARAWIARALGEAAVGDHFAAVSTQLDKVARIRHRAGPDVRLLGLGRRALFDLVEHRPAARHRHRPGAFRGIPARRLRCRRAFPRGAAASKTSRS